MENILWVKKILHGKYSICEKNITWKIFYRWL